LIKEKKSFKGYADEEGGHFTFIEAREL